MGSALDVGFASLFVIYIQEVIRKFTRVGAQLAFKLPLRS
jgi:hypothetical protein